MSMTIYFTKHLATPNGNHPVGTILDVADDRAKQLIKELVAIDIKDAPHEARVRYARVQYTPPHADAEIKFATCNHTETVEEDKVKYSRASYVPNEPLSPVETPREDAPKGASDRDTPGKPMAPTKDDLKVKVARQTGPKDHVPGETKPKGEPVKHVNDAPGVEEHDDHKASPDQHCRRCN